MQQKAMETATVHENTPETQARKELANSSEKVSEKALKIQAKWAMQKKREIERVEAELADMKKARKEYKKKAADDVINEWEMAKLGGTKSVPSSPGEDEEHSMSLSQSTPEKANRSPERRSLSFEEIPMGQVTPTASSFPKVPGSKHEDAQPIDSTHQGSAFR